VDTYLAIASKRDQRQYADREIANELVERILDAGRLAGNAANRQPWRFLVVESPDLVQRVAETVYSPRNVLGATLVVAIVTEGGRRALDVGRAAQNMMLAAWNDGVTSCPNGMPDADRTARELGLGNGERPVLVLSFGYPARPRDPESRPAEEWSRRANRMPLDAITERV
jgi:nitroreductase